VGDIVRRNMNYSDKRINKRVVENEETEMGEKSPFPSHWPHHIAEEQDIKKKEPFLRRFIMIDPVRFVFLYVIFLAGLGLHIGKILPLKYSLGIISPICILVGAAVILNKEIYLFDDGNIIVGKTAVRIGWFFICLGIFMLSTLLWL